MKTILSTKSLSHVQRERILNGGLAVVDFDFINTEKLSFKVSSKIENAIFTSQKAVKVVFARGVEVQNAYCVGKRTERLIVDSGLGINIKYVGDNAVELSAYIVNNASDKFFHYFCAKDRLETLPTTLSKNNINWSEIPVYKTIYTPKKYNQKYDGVLFFSPSGVESYFSVNDEPEHSFCIGNTTAKALKKYTKKYTVASQTTVENVLVKAIKHFKND